jgi:beta-N-acetylhexosaminidase
MVKLIQKTIFVLLIGAWVISCSPNYAEKSKSIVRKMDIDQKIGQLLVIGVSGKKVTSETKKIIKAYRPGGILLFGYNIDSNLKLFLNNMQHLAMKSYKIPLFMTLDQEGGRVKRIRHGVTQFPGNMAMGVAADGDLTYLAARILGIELRNLGINMNLAPDVDINNNPDNPVINTRAFGSNARLVSEMGEAYIDGLQDSKCMAVAKHFPGHGDTSKDSHLSLPVIPYTLERLRKVEFVPFQYAIDSEVAGIMSAHIAYPNILKNRQAATLSSKFMTDILRTEMKYEGLIFTDDLEMNAIDGNMKIGDAAVKSIKAGVDIILVSSYGKNVKSIFKTIKKAYQAGEISESRIDRSVQKIIEMKLKYSILEESEKGELQLVENVRRSNEQELLMKAAEINKTISQEALYFYQNKSGLKFAKPVDKDGLVITNDNLFVKILKKSAPDYSIISTTSFKKYIADYYTLSQQAVGGLRVYCSVKSKKDKYLSDLDKLHKKYKFELIYVSANNPFKVTAMKNLKPTIFSFSNTKESYRAVVSAMRGFFEPKTKINLNMGIGRNR